jgi:hypothetical protein
MENKRKHLDFIQNIISRMSSNLFFLRGWTITLVTGLFAILAKEENIWLLYVVYFPIVIFWILDGYFLSQERLFRALYDRVRLIDPKNIDFSLDTTPFKSDCRNSWLFSAFSTTLLIFYVPLIVAMIVLTYLLE